MELQELQKAEEVRLEVKGRASFGMELQDWLQAAKVFSLRWKFEFGRRLRKSDWKEPQEVPSGWNFKSRKLLRLG